MTKKTKNIIMLFCLNCGKHFPRRRGNGYRHRIGMPGLRPSNSITCSSKCSRLLIDKIRFGDNYE